MQDLENREGITAMQTNPYRGCFIVLEGIDGSAKTTQARRLAMHLESHGFRVVTTYEPWFEGKSTEHDQQVQAALRGAVAMDKATIQRLLVANRQRHLSELIIPELTRDDQTIVISDRYCFSTFAYAEVTTALTFDDVKKMHEEMDNFFMPDLTLILDLPAAIAMERIKYSRERRDLFEKIKTLERVRAAYKNLPQIFSEYCVCIVDANALEDTVSMRVVAQVDPVVMEKFGAGEESRGNA